MNKEELRNRISDIAANFPLRLRTMLMAVDDDLLADLSEVRLRRARPVTLTIKGRSLFLGENGALSVFPKGAICLTEIEIEEVFLKFCNHSVYTYQNDIKNGFITLAGGHRVGICGTIAEDERGEICGVRDISTLNIRVAREIRGAANPIIGQISDGKVVDSLLLVSPPGCGKTTILRDLARQLSEQGFQICIIDERGELGAVRSGVPECDIGPASDIYTAIDKAAGMERALRTMSPDIIICDEIGTEADAAGILAAQGCGVQMIASAHAGSIEEVQNRPHLAKLFEAGVFCKVVLLNKKYAPVEVRQLKKGSVKHAEGDSACIDLSVLHGNGTFLCTANTAQN